MTGTSRWTILRSLRVAVVSAFVTYVLNIVTLPIVIQHVGSNLFGAWSTIASILAVGMLADSGIRTELVRRVGDVHGREGPNSVAKVVNQGATLLAVMVGAVAAVGILLTPVIRSFAFPAGVAGYSTGSIDAIIRLSFGLLVIAVVGNGYFAVLRGVQRGDMESLARVVAIPLGLCVTLAGALGGLGIWALLAGNATQITAHLLWQWVATRRLLPSLRFRFTKLTGNASGVYLGLSSLAFTAQLGDVVDAQLDKIILSHFVGPGAVTAFQLATIIGLQAKTLALLPVAPLLVAVAELRVSQDERLLGIYTMLSKVAFIAGSVIFGGIFVFGPAFVRLWVGPGFASAGGAARLFAVAVWLNFVGAPLASRAFGEGLHSTAAISAIANITVNAISSITMTIAFGLNGALYGSILGNLVGLTILLGLMKRKLGSRWRRPPLRAFSLGVGFAAITVMLTPVDRIRSVPLLAISVVAYAAVVGGVGIAAERIPVQVLVRPYQTRG